MKSMQIFFPLYIFLSLRGIIIGIYPNGHYNVFLVRKRRLGRKMLILYQEGIFPEGGRHRPLPSIFILLDFEISIPVGGESAYVYRIEKRSSPSCSAQNFGYIEFLEILKNSKLNTSEPVP